LKQDVLVEKKAPRRYTMDGFGDGKYTGFFHTELKDESYLLWCGSMTNMRICLDVFWGVLDE